MVIIRVKVTLSALSEESDEDHECPEPEQFIIRPRF
jgi:hypothetical protein